MNIELLLQYQDLDKHCSDFDDHLKQTDQFKEICRKNKENSLLFNEIKNSEEEICNLKATLEQFVEKKRFIEKKIEEAKSAIKKIENLEELEKIDKDINNLENEIYNLFHFEKCANRLIECIEKLGKDKEDGVKQIEECKTLRAEFEKLEKISKLKFLSPHLIEMKRIAEQLTKEDIDLFNEAKKTVRKYPYIVEYKDGYCEGCNMEVSSEIGKYFISQGDTYKCPHCQRILFLK